MKKKLLCALLIVFGAAHAFADAKSDAASKPVTLTFGHIFAPETLAGKGGYKFVDLLKAKSALEHDLSVKNNSLFIDREKCLGIRKTFPMAPKGVY